MNNQYNKKIQKEMWQEAVDVLVFQENLNSIPKEFVDDIGYGLYGGIVQFYIKGVDGTLAQLGFTLPPIEALPEIIKCAKSKDPRYN